MMICHYICEQLYYIMVPIKWKVIYNLAINFLPIITKGCSGEL